jgi:site-specific DNA-cytosine methylase
MRAGAVVVDARHFVPQSRPRVFIVAVSKTAKVADEFVRDDPHPTRHPRSMWCSRRKRQTYWTSTFPNALA